MKNSIIGGHSSSQYNLFGICRGTPFLRKVKVVSGWPCVEAMCIRVLPSLVLAAMEALHLSTSKSTIVVCPLSAAKCTGTLSI